MTEYVAQDAFGGGEERALRKATRFASGVGWNCARNWRSSY